MPQLNKANRQVCDVDIRILATKAPFLKFDTANTTTAGLTGDSVFPVMNWNRLKKCMLNMLTYSMGTATLKHL